MREIFNNFRLTEVVDFNLFFTIYTKHNHQLWDLYRKKGIVKNELIRLRFQNTFTDLNINGINPVEMNALYLEEMPKQKVLVEGVPELLGFLKTKNYRMYIITNGFKEVQYKKLESSGLMPFFDKLFISEEIKSPKPGREIFEYSIKSANAKKSKSIMIGDDWEVDVMGALNFGIDAIHYINNNEFEFQRSKAENNTSGTVYRLGSFLQLTSCF